MIQVFLKDVEYPYQEAFYSTNFTVIIIMFSPQKRNRTIDMGSHSLCVNSRTEQEVGIRSKYNEVLHTHISPEMQFKLD